MEKLTKNKRVSPLQIRTEKKLNDILARESRLFSKRRELNDVVERLCPHPLADMLIDEENHHNDYDRIWTTWTKVRCGRCKTLLLEETERESW